MLVPRFTQDRCLIISDGGVESLLAAAMAGEQAQLSGAAPSILLPGWWEPCDELDLIVSAVDPAVVRQASVTNLAISPDQTVYPPEDRPTLDDASIGSLQSHMLLSAAQIALASGIRRVVWPVRAMRPELDDSMESLVDSIARSIDRAILASRLASLDASPDTAVDVVIETPFADLSNAQLADLVADMALPIECCWWNTAIDHPLARSRSDFWMKRHGRLSALGEIKDRPTTRA